MEKHSPHNENHSFNTETSPANDAYLLLNAKTPVELSNLFAAEDQKLMNSHAWDYENPELIVNKIKEMLEPIDLNLFHEEEREWIQEILWFWNHHAISCAIWKHKDREAAKKFAARALEYQTPDHGNQITKLLDHLVNDRIDEARKHAETITEEPEKTTAAELIEEYKNGEFF